jgi:hypothetical protein
LFGGVRARSVSSDFTDQAGLDGWLATQAFLLGQLVARVSLGLGLRGDARQRDPSAALFVVFAPN